MPLTATQAERPNLTEAYGRGVVQKPLGRPYLEVVEDCEGYALEACVELSTRVDKEGDPGERRRRAAHYQEGCEREHDAADCYRLGAMQIDPRELFVPMASACDGGVPQGCFALGAVYFTQEAYDLAFGFFWRACEDQYAPACLWAGRMLAVEDSRSRHDPKLAARFYTRACSMGLPEGCVAYRDLTCARGWTADGCTAP